ncbi:hypothetical protein EON67_11810, partial [archaeon]
MQVFRGVVPAAISQFEVDDLWMSRTAVGLSVKAALRAALESRGLVYVSSQLLSLDIPSQVGTHARPRSQPCTRPLTRTDACTVASVRVRACVCAYVRVGAMQLQSEIEQTTVQIQGITQAQLNLQRQTVAAVTAQQEAQVTSTITVINARATAAATLRTSPRAVYARPILMLVLLRARGCPPACTCPPPPACVARVACARAV